MEHDPSKDSRHPKVLCVECFLVETRYRCKVCGQPVCFQCGLITDLHSFVHDGEGVHGDDLQSDISD